ncbi:RNA-directed DNA polymerase, eukaryota, reverse transcriptase zinc-binding domain protein [Tanacetum coccineum]
MTCLTTPKFTICVNGERFRYFKGGRGLRQGDPISPYIFTVVMEMLNLLVKEEIRKEKAFKYHFGYKQLKITHLCFADDLIMLCHRDVVSVKTLKRALDKFSAISGLYPNLGKCTMFCGSLDDTMKTKITTRKESLWVKWINVVKLKGRSVWDVDTDSRDISLSNMISKKEIFYVGFNYQDKLMDIMDVDGWKWPHDWLIKHLSLCNMVALVLSSNPDVPIWVNNNRKEIKFSTSTIKRDGEGRDKTKNHKKMVKTRQTQKRGTEEHKRSQEIKPKSKRSKLQSTMGQLSFWKVSQSWKGSQGLNWLISDKPEL